MRNGAEFLRGDVGGNKENGYRPGRTYGQGKRLEFRIPRDRYGNFHPQILAILRDQEEECEDVSRWLSHGLDGYYPVLFVDCVHIKVFRRKKAATEGTLIGTLPGLCGE